MQILQNTVLQWRGVDNEDQQRRRPKGDKVNASTGLRDRFGSVCEVGQITVASNQRSQVRANMPV